MGRICQLIDRLRGLGDTDLVEAKESWLIVITKSRDLICEITVPHDILEWSACVRQRGQEKEVWSDWMDYSGYDERTNEELEAEMADDILTFVDRISVSEPLLPLQIYKRRT